jgi:hypothetical protein
MIAEKSKKAEAIKLSTARAISGERYKYRQQKTLPVLEYL